MSEWESIVFDDIAYLIKGISYTSEEYGTKGNGDTFITLKCIAKDGGFKSEGIKYFQGSIPENLKLSKGDLLFANTDLTRDGDIVGCPLFLPLDGEKETITMSMDLSKVVLKNDKTDLNFLYYLLMTPKVRKFMKDNSSGSTVLHLKTSEIPKLKLYIPKSKTEQSKIAEILSSIDKAIDQTEAIIAKQQRIKNGLMQDLLTKGIDKNGNLRSEETHEFKDSELGKVPKEWEVKSLNELIERLDTGVSVNSEDNPASGFEYGVLKTSSLSNCYFHPSENKRIVLKSEIARAKCNPKKGSILISRMNTPALVGENAYVDNDFNNLFLPDRIWQTIFNDKIEINGFWLWKILSSQRYRSKISFLATGTSGTMKNISKNDFLALKVPYLDYSEQIRISDALQKIERVIQKEINHLEKLKRKKTGLMQDLLTGKISVDKLINTTN